MKLKKITSVLAAAALVCTMSTSAFAADQSGGRTGEYNATVSRT